MVITYSSANAIDKFLEDLSCAFPIKDLGRLAYFLSLELDYLDDGVLLSQRKYILDILRKTNMTDANLISSPMFSSLKLSKFGSPLFDNLTVFRSVISSLQYLFLTQLDIFFAVNKVCQFMYDPKLLYWTNVKRIVRYLKFYINHGLFFSKDSNRKLHAYSNVDLTGCLNNRRSTVGFCIFLRHHLVS